MAGSNDQEAGATRAGDGWPGGCPRTGRPPTCAPPATM